MIAKKNAAIIRMAAPLALSGREWNRLVSVDGSMKCLVERPCQTEAGLAMSVLSYGAFSLPISVFGHDAIPFRL
ncbi:MAG: hypothetical protein R3D34_06675 [Nitratireductor sp.]